MDRTIGMLERIAATTDPSEDLGVAERLRAVVERFGFEALLLTDETEANGAGDGGEVLIGWAREPTAGPAAVLANPSAPADRAAVGGATVVGLRRGRTGAKPVGRSRSASAAVARTALDAGELDALRRIGRLVENRLAGAEAARRPAERPTLSRRERECLQWTAAGKTTWEISAILRISQNTIDGYIASATRKLGAVNRTQAVAVALRRRLID